MSGGAADSNRYGNVLKKRLAVSKLNGVSFHSGESEVFLIAAFVKTYRDDQTVPDCVDVGVGAPLVPLARWRMSPSVISQAQDWCR